MRNMSLRLCIAAATLAYASVAAGQYLIRGVAGRGVGDGRPATAASLDSPSGLALAPDGAILIADWQHHRVRRVDPSSGTISTLAGLFQGTLGDGGPATQALLKGPFRVRATPRGDLLVAELGAHRVRHIPPGGAPVSTLAGAVDSPGDFGDGGPAVDARLSSPADAARDDAGNVWIADLGNHRVRKIDPAGTISTAAGNGAPGYAGDGGPATSASLSSPVCVLPGPAGEVYVCDYGNHVIRMIDPAGDIQTIAGTGTAGFSGDGTATVVQLASPSDLAFGDPGTLLVVDQGNHRIRRLDLGSGALVTLAGTGVPSYGGEGVPAATSPIAVPAGIARRVDGSVLFTEMGSHRVRRLEGGLLSTFAGDGVALFGGDGGTSIDATFGELKSVVTEADGSLLVVDFGNARLRRVDASSRQTSTIAGNGDPAFSGDAGPAVDAGLSPSDAVVDVDGAVIFSDTDNNRIRRIDPMGSIATIAGTGTAGGAGDGGAATAAELDHPTGLALDDDGNLYVADFHNHRVRRITPGGDIETVAGTGTAGLDGDGIPATSARLRNPVDMTVDPGGDLYVADYGNNRVCRVDAASGLIETVAGDGTAGSTGDGGLATLARLRQPSDVHVDAAGRLLISDSGNRVIRMVDAGGTIRTIAGSFLLGETGDGGPAIQARLTGALRLAPLDDGRILVADRWAGRIRELVPDADGDLVPDAQDACPASPAGEPVDTTGCSCGDAGHVDCDDGNPCTADTCDDQGLCANQAVADTTPCDDGNACTLGDQCLDGDCRSGSAACGDGVVQASCGESCDAGAANGTDACCSTSCQPIDGDLDGLCDALDPCTNGAPVTRSSLFIREVESQSSIERIRFSGRVRPHFPFDPALDPIAHGVRVLIEASNRELLDTTIPPGAYSSATRIGWRYNWRTRQWTYVDKTSPPLARITRVELQRLAEPDTGWLRFLIIARRLPLSLGAADLPLAGLLVLDPPAAVTGQCGEAHFLGPSPAPSCSLLQLGRTVSCQ